MNSFLMKKTGGYTGGGDLGSIMKKRKTLTKKNVILQTNVPLGEFIPMGRNKEVKKDAKNRIIGTAAEDQAQEGIAPNTQVTLAQEKPFFIKLQDIIIQGRYQVNDSSFLKIPRGRAIFTLIGSTRISKDENLTYDGLVVKLSK
jgi:hypothetical protein